jgi:hypothetical protein
MKISFVGDVLGGRERSVAVSSPHCAFPVSESIKVPVCV